MRADVYTILAAAALVLAISFGDEGCGRTSAIFSGLVPVFTVAAAKRAVKDDAADDEDEGSAE